MCRPNPGPIELPPRPWTKPGPIAPPPTPWTIPQTTILTTQTSSVGPTTTTEVRNGLNLCDPLRPTPIPMGRSGKVEKI